MKYQLVVELLECVILMLESSMLLVVSVFCRVLVALTARVVQHRADMMV